MSLILTNRPQVQRTPLTGISKWSPIHNRFGYRFARRDYSVSAVVPTGTGLTQLTMNSSEAVDVVVGDTLYVSCMGTTATVSNIVTSAPFVYVTMNANHQSYFTSTGYANNHTQRKNYFIDVRINVWNNTTNREEVAGTLKLYPSLNGTFACPVNKWLQKYLSFNERSTYLLTSYEDKDAYARFYISYRQEWDGYDWEIFKDDRVNPLYSANMLTNSKFTLNSSGFDLNGMTWNPIGYIEKPTTNLGTAYARPDNYATFPTTAGALYRLRFKVREQSGTITQGNTLRVWFSDEFLSGGTTYNCGYVGEYEELLFTATNNGDFPTFKFDSLYWGAIDDIYLEEVLPRSIDNSPRWHYTNKGSVYLWNDFDVNQAKHVCFYDTIPVASSRAKFMCDFDEPTYFGEYPFDIAILMDDTLAVVEVKKGEQEITNVFGTTDTLYTLPQTNTGEQRITLAGAYASNIKYVDVWLETTGLPDLAYVNPDYVDADYVEQLVSSLPFYAGEITERRRIRINQKCIDNPVYLAWKGRAGGWNYWCFGKTQTISLTTTNQLRAAKYVDTMLTRENEIQTSVDSREAYKVGASNIDLNDVQGIASILDSGCVLMYVGTQSKTLLKKWLRVIPRAGSYDVYETAHGKHEIEFTIDLPMKYNHTA